MSEKDVLILAIESSCDETAASVVKNGRTILSNVISSQIALHTLYGGVVPEIASRKHIEKINQVVEEALAEANVTLDDLDAHRSHLRSGTCRRTAGRRCGSKSDQLREKTATGRRASYRGTCIRQLYRTSGSGTTVYVSDRIRRTHPSGDRQRLRRI